MTSIDFRFPIGFTLGIGVATVVALWSWPGSQSDELPLAIIAAGTPIPDHLGIEVTPPKALLAARNLAAMLIGHSVVYRPLERVAPACGLEDPFVAVENEPACPAMVEIRQDDVTVKGGDFFSDGVGVGIRVR